MPKRTISARIGPEQRAELDLDSGALTLVESECGVQVPANGVLLLAQFISEQSVIIALHIEKGSE